MTLLRLRPRAGIQALHHAVNDLSQAVAEFVFVHDFALGHGFGDRERRSDEAQRRLFLFVAGPRSEYGFNAMDHGRDKRNAFEQDCEEVHLISSVLRFEICFAGLSVIARPLLVGRVLSADGFSTSRWSRSFS